MQGARVGQILSRVVVPAWVLTGALFKLTEATPKLLPPKTILPLADKAGIDLYLLLAIVIGLEFLAVAVMLCISRLARPMAIFILSVFCLILIGEMVQGNVVSCGCLGTIKVAPWVMLAIDGALLLGVLAFDPSPLIPASPPKWPVGLALLLAIGGFVLSVREIMPQGKPVEVGGTQPTTPDGPPPIGDPTINPSPAPLPAYWFTGDLDTWPGKSWREIDLFSFMPKWPTGMDTGTRYVVFYSRTCDHCEEMFVKDLFDPQLASLVTAVEVPDSKNGPVTSPNAWPMPQTDVEHLQLPVGCEWIITTPLTFRIVDGVVKCVIEGGHRKCMELE